MFNYLNDAETFVMLWILSSMIFGAILVLWVLRKDIIDHFCKTPEQRALDWVNRQIERERKQ